jgi:hypothetical protein
MAQQEEEIIDIDPQYKRGFEQGYWMQRGNRPELQDIMQAASTNQQQHYADGLKAGSKEAIKEQVKVEFDKMDSDKQKDKDAGIDMD